MPDIDVNKAQRFSLAALAEEVGTVSFLRVIRKKGSYTEEVVTPIRDFYQVIPAVRTTLPEDDATVVASVSVDEIAVVRWSLDLLNASTGERASWDVTATHDGTASADATTVDYIVNGLGPVRADIALIAVALSGVGAAQTMALTVTTAAGATGWVACVAPRATLHD